MGRRDQEDVATEAEAEDESSPPTNPLVHISMQAGQDENFVKKKKEDEHLKLCRGQVLVVKCEWQRPGESVYYYFLVKNGLLYYHCPHRDRPWDLLVAPFSEIESIMYLAYHSPVWGPPTTPGKKLSWIYFAAKKRR